MFKSKGDYIEKQLLLYVIPKVQGLRTFLLSPIFTLYVTDTGPVSNGNKNMNKKVGTFYLH